MRFRVLGPFVATATDGKPVVFRGKQQHTLAAVLVCHAGEPVSADWLVHALWPERRPKSYASNLHTYVSRLRERCGELLHHDQGYTLPAAVTDVDLLVFREQVALGRRAKADGRHSDVVRHLRAALALWRGPVLGGRVPAVLDSLVARLEADRLTAFEDLIEAEFALGGHAEVIGELQAALADEPLRERLAGQLVTALYRAGRRADALAVYRRTRERLVVELGIEPGPELRELHSEVLSGTPRTTPPGLLWPVHQLPAVLTDFAGRDRQVATLAGRLRGGGVPVVVLNGEPGAGKSSLAARVAHTLGAAFPDGQLFVPMSRGARHRDSESVLLDLLRTLGVPGAAVPDDAGAAAALYRDRLAGRRVLIVLDDAADPAQVRDLLPGTPGCAVLITSRRRLTGLAATGRLTLGPLRDDEAVDLLTALVGGDRVAAEPDAVARIVAACGNLPLALRIAGARLALRAHLPLRVLADRLQDHRRRLDELQVSDLQVRASLALSYRGLSPAARLVLRMIGLTRTGEVAAWNVAGLTGADPDRAIEELVESGLLEPAGIDYADEPRYRMHDLVRLFARERCLAEDTAAARTGAGQRLMGAAVWLTDRAAARLPRVVPMPEDPEPARQPGLPEDLVRRLLADPVAFLDVERVNLLTLAERMSEHGWHREAARVLDRLASHLWPLGREGELRRGYARIAEQARLVGDRMTEARAGMRLALAAHGRGRYEAAVEGYRAALSVVDGRDPAAAAWARADLSLCLLGLARVPEALANARQAAEWFRANGEQHGLIWVLQGESAALCRLGRVDEAIAVGTEAVALARASGTRAQLGIATRCLSWSRALAGDLPGARDLIEESVSLLRDTTARMNLARSLRALGGICAGLGAREDSLRAYRESAELAASMADAVGEAACERALAAALLGDGKLAEGVELLRRNAERHAELGSEPGESVALRLVAIGQERLGDAEGAAETRQRAGLLDDPSAALAVRLLLGLAGEGTPGSAEPQESMSSRGSGVRTGRIRPTPSGTCGSGSPA